MYGILDYRKAQEPATGGYPALLALTRQLVGERFLFARRGYPDQLKLHFGTPSETPGPNGGKLARGSYVLNALASSATFKAAKLGVTVFTGDDGETFAQPMDEIEFDRLLPSLGGSTVNGAEVAVRPLGYELTLAFSDGSLFTVTPTAEATSEPIPDWELFTPYGRYLCVGPGLKWSYPVSG